MDGQNRIFVGGIPVRVEKKAIVDFFSQFGKIKYCKVKKNSKTGRSLGYAYLTFEDPAALQELVNRQIEFCGRICECKQVYRKTELKEELVKEKRRKLLVYDIDLNITNTDLKTCFESLVSISHAYVVKDPENVLNKGYGYVVFSSEKEVDEFVKRGLNISIEGKPIKYSNEFHMPPKNKETSGRHASQMSEVSSAIAIKKRSDPKSKAKKELKEKHSQSVSAQDHDHNENDSNSSSQQSKSYDQQASINENGCSPIMIRTPKVIGAIAHKTAALENARLNTKPRNASRSRRPGNLPAEEFTGGTKSTRGSSANQLQFKAGNYKIISSKRSLWTQIIKVSAQIDQRDENYKFNRSNSILCVYKSTTSNQLNRKFAW